MNILFSTNSNFIVPTSVMIYSVCRCHLDTPIDFYLAYHDLGEDDIQRLKRIVSHFAQKQLILLDVGEKFCNAVEANAQFSHETYYRILGLNLLPHTVTRILYLDSDMLIQKSLVSLYEISFPKDSPFVACEDIHAHLRDYKFMKPNLHIPEEQKYFNAGMMLFNMEYLRERKSIGYIVDAFIREGKNYNCPDQDILNIMYGPKTVFVPWELYNLPPMYWYLDTEKLSKGELYYLSYPEIFNTQKGRLDVSSILRGNAHIIHYLGPLLKPWKYRDNVYYQDLAFYSDLWFQCEIEMYQAIPDLIRLN